MADSFKSVITGIPGLKHYYPLTSAYGAKDAVGGHNGTVKGNVSFGAKSATFDGKSYIEIPDHNDLSAATTGELTVVLFLTIDNWKGAGASEYVHWAGKGKSGSHEYTFRHYVDGGSGEAAQRQGRTSFYHFNLSGGLGAGSYFQDAEDKVERVVCGTVDRTQIAMWRDGVQRDTDALSGYNIKLANGGAPLCLGSRGDGTGFLVGKLRNVCVFNRKLSAAEIKAIHAARDLPVDGGGVDPTDPPPEPPTPPGETGTVTVAGQEHAIDGVNVAREADQLIQYTPAFGASTKTNVYGAEVTVVGGKVTAAGRGTGDNGIPPGGYVLSGHGEARDWLAANARIGVLVSMDGEEGEEPAPPKPNPGGSYVATGLDDVVGKHNALVNKLADAGLLDPVTE